MVTLGVRLSPNALLGIGSETATKGACVKDQKPRSAGRLETAPSSSTAKMANSCGSSDLGSLTSTGSIVRCAVKKKVCSFLTVACQQVSARSNPLGWAASTA